MALALAAGACLGSTLRTGLGFLPDMLAGLMVGGAALAAGGASTLLLRWALRSWPWRFCFGVLGSWAALVGILLALGLPVGPSLTAASVFLGAAGAVGGGVSALIQGRKAGPLALAAAALVLLAALGGSTALVLRLAGPGQDPFLLPPPTPRTVEALKVPDPGAPGLWKTASLTYGRGTDRHRAEFGRGAALRTRPVDASLILPEAGGWRAGVRTRYWGFGKEALPLNGRVTYPSGKGPFPLVLAVHGDHAAQDLSDAGFEYLGQLLASRGFIFVSVDENFLNGSWEGGLRQEGPARAWLLLKHLEVWREWAAQEGNPFQGKVDLRNIALLGHAQGGGAVALAAAYNRLPCHPGNAALPFAFGFSIRAVAALAPIDGCDVPLEDVDTLVLQGSHDAAASGFTGCSPYDRAGFTGGEPRFKVSVWIYRADHNQFKSAWGRADAGPPWSWFLGAGSLLPGEEQRRVAKVFVSAFLEASLHGREDYLPLFRDAGTGAAWLPRTLFVTRFQTSGFRAVSTSGNTLDLTRTTLPGGSRKGTDLTRWSEGPLEGQEGRPFRTMAVTLAWEAAPGKSPSYTITLPPLDWGLTPSSRLVFSMADFGEGAGRREPVDLTVELVSQDGVIARLPLSAVRPLHPRVDVQRTKWAALDRALFTSPRDPLFQTFELPLALFQQEAPAWSPRAPRQIRFRFDLRPAGRILMGEIGFEP
jgi:hypothetical protein